MSAFFWSRGVGLSVALLAACSGKSADRGDAVAGSVSGGTASSSAGTASAGTASGGGAATAGAAHGGEATGGEATGGEATGSGKPSGDAALGEPCLPDDERDPSFSGFQLTETNIETASESCASRFCVANHFQGRVSCPYGQKDGGGGCTLPGSKEPVTAQVRPQVQERQASRVVTCSCHCAGDGAGPYCTCPDTMECAPLVLQLPGLPDNGLSGSYCILKGTKYDPAGSTTACDAAAVDCGAAHPY